MGSSTSWRPTSESSLFSSLTQQPIWEVICLTDCVLNVSYCNLHFSSIAKVGKRPFWCELNALPKKVTTISPKTQTNILRTKWWCHQNTQHLTTITDFAKIHVHSVSTTSSMSKFKHSMSASEFFNRSPTEWTTDSEFDRTLMIVHLNSILIHFKFRPNQLNQDLWHQHNQNLANS
jgi:hypothetical protein